MSDISQGAGWWLASDGKWYPPQGVAPDAPAAPTMTAAAPPPGAGEATGMQLTTKVFPLAFITYLFKPVAEIDGVAVDCRWGTQFLPIFPGPHTITVFWRYPIVPRCNAVSFQLNVMPGQATRVTYKSRWMVFLPGKIAIEA